MQHPIESEVSTIREVDRYGGAIHGVHVESMRTSRGSSATTVVSVRSDRFTTNSVRSGFAAVGRSTIPDGIAIACAFRVAPTGARWSGVDLGAGDVITYGTGAEHIGINPEGLEMSFMIVSLDRLDTLAGIYDHSVRLPAPGRITVCPSHRAARRFAKALFALRDRALLGEPIDEEDLAAAEKGFLRAVAGPAYEREARPPGIIDDQQVVASCLRFADDLGRIPTMQEIHEAVFVSERRLRYAFQRALGMPPSVALRAWGLDRARRGLLSADPSNATVTGIANQLGFSHHGRFASRYRAAFGEHPQRTLRRTA